MYCSSNCKPSKNVDILYYIWFWIILKRYIVKPTVLITKLFFTESNEKWI